MRKESRYDDEDESAVMIRRRAATRIGVAVGTGKITSGKRKNTNENATLRMMRMRVFERSIENRRKNANRRNENRVLLLLVWEKRKRVQ
jgi:hypothetical protein